nr:phosphopantetheine-binding protein [Streptomyces sp. NBC_00886]
MREEFEKTLRRFLPYLPDDEPLAPETELRDHGLDSLATVELLAALESGFQVRFPEEALGLDSFRTAGVLWETLSTVLDSRATA